MPRGLGVRVPPPAQKVDKAEESGGGREVYPDGGREVPPPAQKVDKAEELGGGREVIPTVVGKSLHPHRVGLDIHRDEYFRLMRRKRAWMEALPREMRRPRWFSNRTDDVC